MSEIMKEQHEIPEGFWKPFLENMISTFEQNINVAPPEECNQTFLGKYNGFIQACPVPPFPQHAQDIKRAVRAIKADYLILSVIGQFLRDEDAKDYMENQKKYGAIQNHPKVKQGLIITIDTRKQTFQGYYELLHDKFAKPVWLEPLNVIGPMTGFFGPRIVRSIS